MATTARSELLRRRIAQDRAKAYTPGGRTDQTAQLQQQNRDTLGVTPEVTVPRLSTPTISGTDTGGRRENVRNIVSQRLFGSSPLKTQPISTKTSPEAPGDRLLKSFQESQDTSPFSKALEQINILESSRKADLEKISEQQRIASEKRQTAFDKLFGEESRLSSFFQPSLQRVQEQILDVEGLLENLGKDVTERFQDTGVTEAQRRRVEAVEREPLTAQLSTLERAQRGLLSGAELEQQRAEREFGFISDQAQAGVDSLVDQLKNSGFDDTKISLIQTALEQQLRTEAAQQKAESDTEADRLSSFEKGIEDIREFVTKKGVITKKFSDEVVPEARRRLAAGEDVQSILADVGFAVSQNPTIRAELQAELSRKQRLAGGGDGSVASDDTNTQIIRKYIAKTGRVPSASVVKTLAKFPLEDVDSVIEDLKGQDDADAAFNALLESLASGNI